MSGYPEVYHLIERIGHIDYGVQLLIALELAQAGIYLVPAFEHVVIYVIEVHHDSIIIVTARMTTRTAGMNNIPTGPNIILRIVPVIIVRNIQKNARINDLRVS